MSQAPTTPLPLVAESAAVDLDSEFRPEAARPPSKWGDARRHPRFAFQAHVDATIHPPEQNSTQTAVRCSLLTRDLSRGGINLIHCEQLFPGQKIEIVLQGARRCVEVVWCRRLTNRCYSAGCRFVKALDESGEPREHQQYAYQMPVDATIFPPPDADAQQPQRQSLVALDVSRSGINLLHTDKLLAGQRLQLVLAGVKQRLEVVVVWCRQLATGCYTAGCRFIGRKSPLQK